MSQINVPVPVAGSRISILRSSRNLPKFWYSMIVGAFDHEFDDLIGRINHSQPIGGFGIIALVKCLINDFQEFLLFMMVGYACGSGIDGLKIVLNMG
jgi:hypothetical protein